ncbi:HlyD family secretion protein [Pedobacter cryoconitis]|uniref:Membrane fusion protein (Multidrug efflux system) n=1 Tax=Pedobacter cryoconitis TaxID=188932 RepID=A0A7X0J979_9SPHI|nr:HlyD family secretion protein [Pedobacter cryoconitis]MBB6502061.1 membrane fusion protein (multidrug efflux system) [Pedobacter cryoconitis]
MKTKNNYTNTDRLITKITAWIAGLIALGLAIWGIISLVQLYNYEDTNDAQIEEYINPITSRVGGFIREIKYEENQDVKKGDTLLVIDNSEYQLQQEEAEAALSNAQAQIGVLESNVMTTSKVSQASESQIASAKAKLVKQQQDFDRYSKLFKVESATQQQLENSKAALDVATSEYRSAVENYQASLSKVNDIKSQKGVYEAEIKRRKALLNRGKLDVSYTVIRAPYNGKMGRRTIQEGQQIQVGQTLAYIVDQEAGKWVIANFKETQIGNMKIDGEAEITADAFPGKTFKGKIVSLSPATGARFSLLPPDNSTGNFVKIVQRIPVKIKLTESKEIVDQLRAGMNANVKVRKN